MHAPPGRRLGKGTALVASAVLPLLASGCGSSSSSDNAALNLPAGPATSLPSATVGGPAVSFAGAVPEVGGHQPATAALARFASALPAGCVPRLERSDPHLISVSWRCGQQIRADTVTLAGDAVGLPAVLTGSYPAYLSAVAAQQFAVEGEPAAATSDLSTWYLTPAALAVVFPAGVVTYPLASLQPYLKDPPDL